ncbi:MAG TPA: ankyrin repeat domain-containing protein [Albitalea sp.]|nr:ankyrin repeat domain-containing protein [Albitalea sp.]
MFRSKLILNFKKIVYLFAAVGVSSALAGSYEDFFRAADVDDPYTVRRLVQRGFDVNSRSPQGQTALILALRGESYKVAEALMQEPTLDVNAVNASDETSLMIAALKGQADWTQRLLERGAQVNKPGWSPLHYAATGPDAGIVKLLLDRGAAADAESPNRSTALMMAAQYGNDASVDLLLARGANPKARNDRGLSAGDFARLAKREALAKRLDALAR